MPKKPAAKDVEKALALADQIVMRQGNIFIRELLRKKRQTDKSIRIGDTEAKIKANLDAAIMSGAITLEDLEEWLEEVEGWGNQHIYLYDVAANLIGSDIFKSPESARKRVKAAGFGKMWGSTAGLAFPDELTLGRITFDGNRFMARWHRRHELWKHDTSIDPKYDTIDGFEYEFRPYRRLRKRSVMRFVLRRKARLAGLFVQLPLGEEHDAAREKARGFLVKLLGFGQEGGLAHSLKSVRIHDMIIDLDSRYIKGRAASVADGHGTAQTKSTKFDADGATIEFDAGPHMGTREVGAMRAVRLALDREISRDPKSFRGESGKFRVRLLSGTGSNRTVTMFLNGPDRRIYFKAQMTSEEVWTVLDNLRETRR